MLSGLFEEYNRNVWTRMEWQVSAQREIWQAKFDGHLEEHKAFEVKCQLKSEEDEAVSNPSGWLPSTKRENRLSAMRAYAQLKEQWHGRAMQVRSQRAATCEVLGEKLKKQSVEWSRKYPSPASAARLSVGFAIPLYGVDNTEAYTTPTTAFVVPRAIMSCFGVHVPVLPINFHWPGLRKGSKGVCRDCGFSYLVSDSLSWLTFHCKQCHWHAEFPVGIEYTIAYFDLPAQSIDIEFSSFPDARRHLGTLRVNKTQQDAPTSLRPFDVQMWVGVGKEGQLEMLPSLSYSDRCGLVAGAPSFRAQIVNA